MGSVGQLYVYMRFRVSHTFHDLKVRAESFIKHGMPKQTSFGDVSHK